MSLVAFALLATAFQYLGSAEARITRPLTALLPAPLARFLNCPPCAGFWHGATLDAACARLGWASPFAWASSSWPLRALVAGLAALVLVPVLRSLMSLGADADG